MSNVKFLNNDEGVSPIVATLVLIVVAIVGAAAVGLIMGTFSNSVSDQANSNNVGSQASNTILVAGSTTLYPAEVLLAKDYMSAHSGVKVTIQQGGSDAGVASAGMGIVDIGASSRAVTNADMTKYPNLQPNLVGGSAVVLIGNTVGLTDITKADLNNLYEKGTIPTGATITKVVQRQEGSGTEETFAKWLTSADATGVSSSLDGFATAEGTVADAEVGNEGVLAYVNAHPGSIGFVDWGYVASAGSLSATTKIIGITDSSGTDYTSATINAAHIKAQLKNSALTDSTGYVPGLIKSLYMITNGAPSPVVKDFITFAQSPSGAADFDAAGMFGVTEFA